MESQTIKKLPSRLSESLIANQVAFDISLFVKELIENSLDANCKTISMKQQTGNSQLRLGWAAINLVENGLESMTVIDDGDGIPGDLEEFGKHQMTTKLVTEAGSSEFYGFRGEALFALIRLCKTTKIKTRTTGDLYGKERTIDSEGNTIQKGVCSMKTGTSIEFNSVYHQAPIRKNELAKNGSKNLEKLVELLKKYAIAFPQSTIFLYNRPRM